MTIFKTHSTLRDLQSLVLASFAVSMLFLYQGHIGFNLWDEGYLWYGSQRVMLGEIPVRDFMSYDPGRYYWAAGLMSLLGDEGIMSLRTAVAVFQAVGLCVALLLISRIQQKQNFIYLVLSAITLIVWMYPRHKLFDITLSILLIGSLAFLVESPTNRRYLITGISVGLIAVFGRNHGFYGAVASIGVLAWLAINNTDGSSLLKKTLIWATGVVIGYMPVLIMAITVPDFANAFWESIRFLFEIKATNLPLPTPWPWKVNFASAPWNEALRGVLVGLYFIAIIIFGILSLGWVTWQKIQKKSPPAVLVATSFLALPYAHYAYSRADVGHLAQGIFPLLIGCLAFLAIQPRKIKWSFGLTLCSTSLVVMSVIHPAWQCYTSNQWVNIEISGDNLIVDPNVAKDVTLLRTLADQYAPNGQSFIAAPFWPGAYPLLNRKSPMWEIYALFPRPAVFEEAEIERIKTAQPGFALIFDFPLDGRDDLRFKNTHPLIHQYIIENFDRLPESENPAYQIYRAKVNIR